MKCFNCVKVKLELQNSPIFEDLCHCSIIGQQDGAHPHYGCDFQAFLKANFTEIRSIKTIEWFAGSLDLSPCDFGMWGLLKVTSFW